MVLIKQKTEEVNVEGKDQKVTYGILNWGPCIVQLKIDKAFQDKLLQGGLEAQKENLDYRKKLAGILKEEYAFKKKEDYLPEIAQCLGIYDAAYQKWKNEAYDKKPNYMLTALWTNFMHKHEFNPVHDHSDTLSFVIFLKVPEEIKQEQRDNLGKSGGPGSLAFIYGEGTRQAITYQSIIPNEGDMFIFPAWVKHYVAPFYSDVTRISVSGNITDTVPLNAIHKHVKAEQVSADQVEKGRE